MAMTSQQIASLATDAAARYGVDPTALMTVLHIENPAGDPAARNPMSGATGLGQFMPATARQYGLTDRTDATASVDAAARYMRDNAATLTNSLGRAPTVGEQYLAYQQGATGALRLLSSPNAPASSIVGRAAVTQNGGTAGMTASQFAGLWTNRADQIAGRTPPANISTAPPNSSGSPDDRGENVLSSPMDFWSSAPDSGYSWGTPDAASNPFMDASAAPVPLAPLPTAAQLSALPQLNPPAGAAPSAPQQQTVTIGGHQYVVGQSYQLGNGASFTASSDGKFVKTANPIGNPTPLQLAIQAQAPGAMANLNNAVDTAKGVGGSALNAVSGLGSMLGGLFGPHPAQLPPALVPGSDNAGWGSLFPPQSSGNAASAPVDQATNGGWNSYSQPNTLAGGAQLPAGVVPAGAASVMAQAKAASNGQANSDSWGSLLGSFSIPSPTYTTPPQAAPVVSAPTQKTVMQQEINPAYTKWVSLSAGADSDPYQNAAFNYAISQQPAPPKFISVPKVISVPGVAKPPVVAPVPKPAPARTAPSFGSLFPAAAPAPTITGAPIPVKNGYLYAPNSAGAYTNVGQTNTSLTPAQLYAAAASAALSTQPNGGYQPASGAVFYGGGMNSGSSGGQDRAGGGLTG